MDQLPRFGGVLFVPCDASSRRILMRKLLLTAVIGVALFATAHAADLATIVAGDPVMPWVIAAVTWVAFWSGLLALVWTPKPARAR
jgi:hypothetical protein